MVLAAWRRRRRVRGVVRGMVEARRNGHGVYVEEWWLPAVIEHDEDALEPLLAWLRQTLAHCRRPHGIDQFDLAIAASVGEHGRVRSASFRDLQPALLYSGSALAGRIAAFLQAGEPAQAEASVRVAMALFSWGDAAHAALPATA